MIYCSQLRATPSADCNISHIAAGLSNYLIHIVFKVCCSDRIWIFLYSLPFLRIVFVVLDCLLGHLGFRLLELRKGIMMALRHKSSRSFLTLSKALGNFYFKCFRSTILLLSIVIFAWNYHSLDSLTRNQQGLEKHRAFNKGFSLRRSIMPTTEKS